LTLHPTQFQQTSISNAFVLVIFIARKGETALLAGKEQGKVIAG
jgi:hypothetical protein